jgi:hypothetical protein
MGQLVETRHALSLQSPSPSATVETRHALSLQQNSLQFDISQQVDGIYLLRILNKDGSVAAIKKIAKVN